MTTAPEDGRLTAGRHLLEVEEIPSVLRDVVSGLIAYGEERMRVNVGLLMENTELKRRVQELEEGPKTDE